jgi:hypothetical protein
MGIYAEPCRDFIEKQAFDLVKQLVPMGRFGGRHKG